jgi:HPt (histidine-containing phosphotransfer) domain-containing protein
MIPAPIPANDEERLAALHEIDYLSAHVDKTLSEITLLAAQICDTHYSTITMVDRDVQIFKARQGFDVPELPRETAFCGYTILGNDELFIVEDATKDNRFHDNPLVVSEFSLRLYAGMPLATQNNLNIGTLCVGHREVRSLTEQQKAALKILGHQAATQLELMRFLKRLRLRNHDMQAIMDHISMGICAFDQKQAVLDEYSKHLQNILGTSDISGKNIIDLIFKQSNLTPNQLDLLKNTVAMSIDADEVGFKSNEHNLPREAILHTRNGKKFVELQWDAITQGQDVEKVLVTIKDITLQKSLQEQALTHKEDMVIVQELIDIPEIKFQQFYQSAERFIEDNKRLIKSNKQLEPELVKMIFINMHTIKGDARSLRFSRIVEQAHQVEEHYSQLRRGLATDWNQEAMLQELDELSRIVKKYQEVGRTRLGRTDELTSVKLDRSDLQKHLELLEKLDPAKLDEASAQALRAAVQGLKQKVFNPVRKVMEDFTVEIDRLARDLSKEKPETMIDATDLLLTDRGTLVIRKVFTHLIRNAVDHGIETAEERITKGKKPRGHIRFHTETASGNRLLIRFFDDGRGLNINRIREIGRAKGLCSDTDSVEKVANLVFINDFSTSSRVTDISGRGVGMSAVRQYLQEEGGTINLVLESDRPNAEGFIPFHFELTIPAHLWQKAA